jgi:hypothetical protein
MATVNAIPATLDITLYAGDDVAITLTISDDTGATTDLTGSLLAQIRKGHDQVLVESFSANAPDPITGICYLSLTHSQTEALGDDGGRHSWDLQLTDGMGLVTTLVKGAVTTQLDISEVGLP